MKTRGRTVPKQREEAKPVCVECDLPQQLIYPLATGDEGVWKVGRE